MNIDESKMIGELQPEALRRVQGAKIALLEHRPFYGTLLASLPLIANWSWLETAATDHKAIYFNPEFIMGMPVERKKAVFGRIDANTEMSGEEKQKMKDRINVFFREKTMKEVVFILMHEIRHITNDHLNRGKAFDHHKFNIAADHYIHNQLILKELSSQAENLRWFRNGVMTTFEPSEEFGFLNYCFCDFKFARMTSEQIYALLPDEKPEENDAKGLGVHIGDYDPERNILGYTELHPVMGDAEEDDVMSQSQSLVETACKVAGDSTPEDVREFVAKFGKPQIDYLKIIKNRMLSRLKSSLTYTRPARRSGTVTKTLRDYGVISRKHAVILPGRKKQTTVDIVLAFDVSGSIGKEELNRIFTEILGLTSLYKEFRVTLFAWSTKVFNHQIYTKSNAKDMLDYEVQTTGGTDPECVFEYIEKNIPNAKEVIVFTDGYFQDLSHKALTWGKQWNTLWVIIDNPNFKTPFGTKADLIQK